MLTKSTTLKRLLSSLLCLVIMIGFVPVVPVLAEVTNPARVEIFLAADAASNNMSLDGFESALKTDMQNRYGYPSDKVFVTSVESQSLNASNINWYEFDHTNNSSLATSTDTKVITYDSEPYSNLVRNRHIVFSNLGKTIDFFGYGEEPYRDFLFTPDQNANNKVFTFTMNEAAVSYHTLMFGGFLFNAKYSYNQSTGERLVSGYVIGIAESDIRLYQITNMSVADLMSGAGSQNYSLYTASEWQYYLNMGYTAAELNSYGMYLQGTQPSSDMFKLITSVSKPSSVNNYRYLKLVATPTEVSLYQFTNDTYATTSTGGKIFENYKLPTNFGSFGFGPFAAYASHGCSQLTQLTFSNLTLSTNTSTSFVDTVRSINWQFKDSMKLIVNVDNDGVNEFGNAANLGTILYYLGLNNAHYVGWGINNPISIGADTTVIGQASNFITRNMGKGSTINRSLSQTDTLSEGISALSDYILDKYDEVSPINPPKTKLTFGANGAIQINVTDSSTSANNPIGAYQWRYMNVATGSWTTSSSTTAAENFAFAAGTYNMVAVRIQDAVSGVWSDYTIAYIANDTSVQPIAQFNLNANELMPDSSIESLKTGWSVTASDLSYHPAGSALSAWEWKVYNSTLTEQTDMASTDQNPTFNFNNKPAGTYTVKLRVKTGTGSNWSTYFTQNLTLFLESDSINISRTSPTGNGPFAITGGGSSFGYDITSTNPVSRYRVLRVTPASGEVAAEGWQLASSNTVSSSGTVSSNTDIYVQALDTSGNSKLVLIGEFRLDMVKPVLSLDTNGYTADTWTNQSVKLNLTNSAANTSPINLQYKADSGNWTTFDGNLTISADGSHSYQFKATSSGGTVSDIVSTVVKVDKTAPTNVKIQSDSLSFSSLINTVVLKYFFKTSQTFNFSANCDISGLASLEYQLLDRSTTFNAEGAWTSGTTVTVDPTRDFVIYVRATDNAGNQTMISTDGIMIENSAPRLAIEPSADMILYKNSTEYTQVIASDSGSGLKSVTYSTNEATPQTGTVNLVDGIGYVALANNGAYRVTIQAEDNSGNITTVTRGIKIDKTSPTISVSGNTTSYLQADSVSITPAASLSGIAKVEVQKDGGSYTDITSSYAAGYAVTANGIYTFRVTNGAGSTATASITYSKIDTVKPVVSINSNGYSDSSWTKQQVTLNVSNASANLGTATYAVSIDGVSYTNFNGTYTINIDSARTYYFRATSASGVVSEAKAFTVKVDKTAPAGTITFKENNFSQFLNSITFGLLFQDTVDVTISGADSASGSNSGVASIEYQKVASVADYSEAGTWTAYSPFSVATEGQFVIYARITDYAGNSTIISSNGAIVDKTEPVISVSYAKDNIWTTDTNPQIGVQVSDSLTGVKAVAYSINGGSPVTASGNRFDIGNLQDGSYIVAISATDNSGNVATREVVVKKDTTTPSIEVSGNTTDYLQSSLVTVTPVSSVSAIAKVEVKKDGGNYEDITSSYASGYSVIANGTYTFRVTSGAGVTATTAITYSMIDSVQPVVAINADNNYVAGEWTNHKVILSASNTSPNLGQSSFEISADGENFVALNGSYDIDSDSDVTYFIRATSASGVVSAVQSFNVRLDKTAPTGMITIAENSFKQFLNTISFGLFFKETVDVTINAEDVGHINVNSGVATIEYQKVAQTADYQPNGTWIPYAAFSVEPDEQFVIYARITDNAGNVTVINSEGFITETTAPVLTLDPAADMTSYKSQPETITVNASDAFSGLKSVTYTTDEAIPQAGTVTLVDGMATITLVNDGAYTLTVQAEDLSGNVTMVTREIKIDQVIPTLAVSGNPTSIVPNATLLMVPTLGGSGLKSITVAKDGGSEVDLTKTYQQGYLINASGRYVFTITSNAGLASQTTVDVTTVDSVKPVALVNSNGYASGTWTSQNVQFQVSNISGNQGQNRFEYLRDNGTWIGFDGSVTEMAEGIHTYQFRVISAAGIGSDPVTITVNRDTTKPVAPSIEIKAVNGGTVSRFLNLVTFKLLFNQVLRVSLTTSDSGSGVATLNWKTGTNSEVQTVAADRATFDLPVGFSGQIIAYAIDQAGMQSDNAVSEGILTEKNAPAFTFQKTASQDQISLAINLQDNQSGLRSLISKVGQSAPADQEIYTTQQNPVTEYTLNLSVPTSSQAAADCEVTVMAYDLAGNSSTLSINLLPDVVKARIQNLPDPRSITGDQLAAAAEEIKVVKNLYNSLTAEQQQTIDSTLVQKLTELYNRSAKLFIVETAEIPGSPKTTEGSTTTQVIIKNIDTHVVVPELADPAVDQVTIKVEVEQMDTAKLGQFIVTAEDSLKTDNTEILQYLDLSLMKYVKQLDGSEYSAKVENSQITGYLTIQIPLPAEYENRTNLHIVYIDDQGNVTPFDTQVVVLEGQKFLQFETNHFSIYAIAGDMPAPVSKPELTYYWILGLFILTFIFFLLILFKRRKKVEKDPSQA